MPDRLGYSVYLSNFDAMKEQLSSLYQEGSCIFTSFHVSEEFDGTYPARAETMCRELSGMGYEILADVSKKTLDMFDCRDIVEWARGMGITALRLDYGFSPEETAAIAAQMPVCVNASTVSDEELALAKEGAMRLWAMHNFYPRPETGLDAAYFTQVNRRLRQAGIRVLAFIPGDRYLRGPLHEGLPTLESHRGISPYCAWMELKQRYQVDQIFVGDGILSEEEQSLIDACERDGILRLPVTFCGDAPEEYRTVLCEKPFTVRVDSPRWLKRLKESREYSCFGQTVAPDNCGARDRGAVTIDNERYGRYSGEVQIIRESLPADRRVNVLAQVPRRYQGLLDLLENGRQVWLLQE